MGVFSQSPGQPGNLTLIVKVPSGKLHSLFAMFWIPCPEHNVNSDEPPKLVHFLTDFLPVWGDCLKGVGSDLLT